MTASTDEVVIPPLSPWRRFWRGLQKVDEALAHTEADDLWDRIGSLEARVDALSQERPPAASTVSAGAEPGPPQS